MFRRSVEMVKVVAVAALLVVAAGCEERQGLLDPDPGGTTAAPSPVLPEDSVLREGVLLRIRVRGNDAGARVRVSALLVDSTRNVAWRSEATEAVGGAALVAVRDIPSGIVGKRLLLTAFVESEGARVYAHSDTAGATTLAAAQTREVQLYAGLSLPANGVVRGLVASGPRGEAYFTVVGGGDVRVVDLVNMRLSGPVATDRGEVWDLAVAGGTLAYLADAGSRVRFVRLGEESSDSAVLGPLVVLVTRSSMNESGDVEVDTLEDVVRPYATHLRMVCLDVASECASPVAVLVSPTQAGGSVVRLVSPSAAVPAVLVADHGRLPGSADTVPATIRFTGPRRPDGQAETVLERSGVAGCASLRFGYGGFDVSAAGTAFSAGGDGCGPAGRVVRVDGAVSVRPTLSRLGLATMAAEDRIRRAVEVVAAPDGERTLVREPEAVWLLDRDLRVLGFKAVSTRARVAWVTPSTGAARRFVVADDGRLDVFEADRFGLEQSVAVGPLAGAPLAVVSTAGHVVVAVLVPAGEARSIVTVQLGAR